METVFGIDLGTNSLGWAAVAFKGGNAAGICNAGVRIFPAGVDELERDGRGTPRNHERRNARQIRKQLERRARRRNKLFRALQRYGLLPQQEGRSDEAQEAVRHDILKVLDQDLLQDFGDRVVSERFFHMLRARALDEKLPLYAVGRVLYQLAQHRGFLSNRKADRKDDESSKVLEAIKSLQARMQEGQWRTLGEYLFHVDSGDRLRARWTSRGMYLGEFKAIWLRQAAFHPERMTEEARAEIHDIIFRQRKLKSSSHLVGDCDLEPGKKRCIWAMPDAQRFRLLQRVNDLEWVDGETGEESKLTSEQRSLVLSHLEQKGDLSFTRLRTLLKNRRLHFNLEDGGDKGLVGDRTRSKLLAIDSRFIQALSKENLDKLVVELLTVESHESMVRRLVEHWACDVSTAEAMAKLSLEDGRAAFSLKAIRILLPELELGLPLNTAIKKLYPQALKDDRKEDRLPPVSDVFPNLRNPVVARALTQLRQVVNSYITKHGLPDKFRIEMARSLKQTPGRREEDIKRNRRREKERDAARERILREAGFANPSRMDIEKLLLAEECSFTCPYTGEHFGMSDLFNGRVDVEHIIPRSRSLDNSFANKTLCMADENKRKGRRTPVEAYGGQAERMEEILERVKRFKGDFVKAKLDRFQMKAEQVEDLLSDFEQSQLVDTAYATRLAGRYLGMLFGGEVDPDGKRRVDKVAGRATALLRSAWRLNEALHDNPTKNRGDHRHHTLDALVVAVSTPSHVKQLSQAMERCEEEGRRVAAMMDEPWSGFSDQAAQCIQQVVPSHKVNRRVRGALHNESNFSPRRDAHGRPDPNGDWVHIRKPIEGSFKLEDVVDPAIRALLQEAEAQHGSKWNQNPATLPVLVNDRGEARPVRHVRIRKKSRVTAVGEGHRTRYVETGGNHHIEVLEGSVGGKAIWSGVMVSSYEANLRRIRREPVILKDHGPGLRYLFSLQQGDCFYLDDDPECIGPQIIRSLDDFVGGMRIWFVSVRDARKMQDIRADKTPHGKMKARGIKTLGDRGFRKVHVGLLGEIGSGGADT
ncbi:MAG: type II CRISPR RNA-guided endonuclease Cas9 [Gammaproteobacteria bacterium]|nr:type II CRISPR RNA-guided endonuclease Cas9 [Gammaproteobacteria bacterium]